MKPVVFLHGFLGTCRDFQPVVQRLSTVASCHCIGLPGHGLEKPGDFDYSSRYIAEKIRDLHLSQPPLLVGYSLGGRLALHTLKNYPGLASGLVLIAAHFGLKGNDQKEFRCLTDHKWAERLRTLSFQEFLSKWYEQDLFKNFVKLPKFQGAFLQKLASHNPFFLAEMLEFTSLGRQEFLENVFLSLGADAMYIAGKDDFKFCTLAQELQKKSPKSIIHIIPNARHVVHLEFPDLVSDYIKAFLLKEM